MVLGEIPAVQKATSPEMKVFPRPEGGNLPLTGKAECGRLCLVGMEPLRHTVASRVFARFANTRPQGGSISLRAFVFHKGGVI